MKLYFQYKVFSSKRVASIVVFIAVILAFSLSNRLPSIAFLFLGLASGIRRWYLLGSLREDALRTSCDTLSLLSIPHDHTTEEITLRSKNIIFHFFSLGTLTILRTHYDHKDKKQARAIESILVKELKK